MFIQLHNATHHYRSEGEGPPVVLLHGMGGSANTWYGVTQTLALHHHVIAPDLRGFGQSERLTGPITIREYASDVLALIDALELPPVTIVGHSMGSLVAQMCAVMQPTVVNNLVLAGPVSWYSPEHRRAYLDRAQQVTDQGLEPLADDWLHGALSDITRATLPQVAGLARDMFVHNDPVSYAHACTAMANYSPVDHQTIGQPTLLLVGDRDVSTPIAMAEELDAIIPVSRMRIIPNAAHWLTLEQPGEVTRAIMEWMSFR